MATSQTTPKGNKTTDAQQSIVPPVVPPTNGGAGTAPAKAKKEKKPKLTAAQRADVRRKTLTDAIGRIAKRVPFVDNPPQAGESSTVACAIVNSVMLAIVTALEAGTLKAHDVLIARDVFIDTAGVEEVDAPMGGTTFQRREKAEQPQQ